MAAVAALLDELTAFDVCAGAADEALGEAEAVEAADEALCEAEAAGAAVGTLGEADTEEMDIDIGISILRRSRQFARRVRRRPPRINGMK